MKTLDKFTLATLFVVLMIVGVSYMRDSGSIEEPPSHVTAELLRQLRAAHARQDTLRLTADSAGHRANHYAISFVIDTTPATPTSVVPGTTISDTTRLGWVQRVDIAGAPFGQHYSAPMFFIDAYGAQRTAYLAEHELRVYDERYVIPLHVALEDSLAADRKDAYNTAATWKRRARANLLKGFLEGGAAGAAIFALLHGG